MPARIEYDFKWWGLGNPAYNQQTILLQQGAFINGYTPVSSDAVANLVKAITHLHPILAPVKGNSHLDDFPTWIVQLTDAQGYSILVYSSSAENAGSGPWNVLYNGQLYAQYDGSLAGPLNALFPNETIQAEASFTSGPATPGSVSFATQKWDPQLSLSFSGLSPVADGFSYFADADQGVITGIIQGRNALGGFSTLLAGTAAQIQHLSVVRPDGHEWPCPVQSSSVESYSTGYPAGPLWKFTCNIPGVKAGQPYLYPFELQFVTELGQLATTSGALKGVWGAFTTARLTPPPEAIQQALSSSATVQDLLKDHALAGMDYLAEIQSGNAISGTLAGTALLAGQAELNGQAIRYLAGTPFVIQDGRLVRWDLSRPALEQLFQEAIQQPVTQRILAAAPYAILNLWYSELGTMPEVSGLVNAQPIDYEVTSRQCAGQIAWQAPDLGKPLRAFGFGADWYFDQAAFVLIDGKPVVSNLDLWPSLYDHGGMLSTLIPAPLTSLPGRPYDRIRVESKSSKTGAPTLSLWIPNEVSQVSGAALNNLLNELPPPSNHSISNIWEFSGVTVSVKPDGSLEIVDCGE